ncbi:unnamed protein product [Acanthosepion pharaonis]|uniref:Uncharacterized protein n=1 Tax=Acanthosepion pharaonis TaxID=158019 RepID=A0A812BCB8_ACAPH|nr:unnamed protein product [Sepia pharaonis]
MVLMEVESEGGVLLFPAYFDQPVFLLCSLFSLPLLSLFLKRQIEVGAPSPFPPFAAAAAPVEAPSAAFPVPFPAASPVGSEKSQKCVSIIILISALLAAVEENESLTTRMLADDFNVNHSTIVRRLKKLGKIKMVANFSQLNYSNEHPPVKKKCA